MADGAAEITKSMREISGLHGINDGKTQRLMCWPHTYKNYSKQLAPIKKINKMLAKDDDNNIQNMQWMVQSEEEFSKVFLMLEEKYLGGDYTEEELQNLKVFFSYFRKQWGPGSPVFRWYKGANLYSCSNNMGLEGRSPEIYTDREGVTWIFFFFSLLYSCLILPTPVDAPLTMIEYHLGQAPRLFFTLNEPILKYCVCHTVTFFDFFLLKTCFLSLFNQKIVL